MFGDRLKYIHHVWTEHLNVDLETCCFCSEVVYIWWLSLFQKGSLFVCWTVPILVFMFQLVCDCLSVGTNMLLPSLGDRMELLHSLLPQTPHCWNVLSQGQVSSNTAGTLYVICEICMSILYKCINSYTVTLM